ncbi:carboxyl transferase domain-containing protein [Streptomyces sp. NPDC052236]|uniref:carboxyl transferase domain-containing protein n=1 Tax=Streptomyces sp. NPDC052236 TaxID=3365686 RepID=UPI0037D548EC
MTDRASAREAIASVTDIEAFRELAAPGGAYAAPPDGPIGWAGYDALRARAAARTGETESVVCGTGRIGATEAVLISFEFGFLGGSLGERTGDRLEAAHTHARERGLPVVSLIATGGSRMQEGMRALVQLQRVARQSTLTRDAGLPQLAVVRDPTTGGGWATLGAGADVILALPGAQIGFAGSRVRPADADPAAYTAEAQLAAGAIDAVVREEELATTLDGWLTLLTGGPGERGAGLGPEHVRVTDATEGADAVRAGHTTEPPDPGRDQTAAEAIPEGRTAQTPGAGPARLPAPPPRGLGRARLPGTGWDAVLQARSPERPPATAYLDAYFTHRQAISGDRCGSTDPGMLCGFGLHDGRTVAYAAQCGTATLPAGYRTAARLIRLAERLGIPVLTLIDTPGAANGAEAERAGAGAAIAEVFAAVAAARVPVTSLVIGEGGSGGALALAAPGNTWVTPDSYFSVIAPELAAAILKRGPQETRATAGQLRLRPQDLVDLGVARGVVPVVQPEE